MTIKYDPIFGGVRSALSWSSISPSTPDPTKQLVAYYGFRNGAKDLWWGYHWTTNGWLTKIELPDGSKKWYDFNSTGYVDFPANAFFYRPNDFTVVQNVKVGTNGKSYSVRYGHIAWGIWICQIYWYWAGWSEVVNIPHTKSLGDFMQVAWSKSSVTWVKVYFDGTLVYHDPLWVWNLYGWTERITCIGKTWSLPYDWYNGWIYDHWNYVWELSGEVIWHLAENYGFATDFIPYVGRTGKLFDVGLDSDANLVAYWPLHDGNLVDTVAGHTLQNFWCSYVPGKGMFAGSLADYANPDYRNLSNHLHCPDSLAINGGGDVIVMAQIELFHASPSGIDQPVIVAETSWMVSNGLIASKEGPYVTAFRLAEWVQWQFGKSRLINYSTSDIGTWTHFMMRKVWWTWMETIINCANPGGGDSYPNYGWNLDDIEPGFSVFWQKVKTTASGYWAPHAGELIRQSTALVKEIAVFNSYNPADPNGWTKFYEIYSNPS